MQSHLRDFGGYFFLLDIVSIWIIGSLDSFGSQT